MLQTDEWGHAYTAVDEYIELHRLFQYVTISFGYFVVVAFIIETKGEKEEEKTSLY